MAAKKKVQRKQETRTVQVTIRVPSAWLDDADRLTESFAGTRTAILRHALGKGLAAMNAAKG